jgi:choline dehydrogenase-like flavoprotein
MSKQRIVDETDFVVIGTGAGGATAARVLSAAGHGVVMLEEGPQLRTGARPRELLDAMAQSMRDLATQTTRGGHPIPLLQGKCVGGSTAINSAIIWRLPEDVRTDWIARFGLGELLDADGLEETFTHLEAELGVHETDAEVRGGNNERMARGAAALGLPGRFIHRNTKDCRGAGQCLQGCPNNARQSMDVSYVPRAIADGARLHVRCRARKLLLDHGRAVGVVGDMMGDDGRRTIGSFEVRARRGVIVAAGALHTPVLLQRAGLRGLVGERFQSHPGCAVVGEFEDSIGMSFGATQGYEVPMRERGFKIEALSLPPETLAARLPGAGAEWQERLAKLDRYAQWCVPIRMEAMGTVRRGFGDVPVVNYVPTARDFEKAREAVILICRMMFAAGAKEVYPGIARRPEVLRSVSDLAALETGELRPSDFHMMASHLFGTACAGSDPRRSVVGPDLQSHEVPGLYVMDASVFPTNLGVNPQHSIMALVFRASERLANASQLQLGAARVAAT